MTTMENSISIIIASSGRVEKIRRLLDSLCRVHGRAQIRHDIVIANNATNEVVAASVKALTEEYDGRDGVRCWQVPEPIAGKCRAQNKTIPLTAGNLIALMDDDVEVLPEWLAAIDSFFKHKPHDVMQGAILMRPEDQQKTDLLAALYRYRTMDFVNYGAPAGADLKTLTGGNMAVRREVFDATGLFDERLGPGGHGISEDVEFAKRVLQAGKRIGWEPKAAVYNELDPARLCEEEFRRRHEAQGRSRLAYKNSSYFSIVPNILRSICRFGWYSIFGNVRKKYRAKGRYYHYRAMLDEKAKTKSGIQA
ncbi:MAG: glycosyltransferase family 2 protein [Deltaproteobacteria bacterium]|nr:glycosyltransferase family 2 protein [Deltaproteobacteria bacterium]